MDKLLLVRRILSIAASVGVIAAGALKYFNGDSINYTEMSLALTTIAAAIGFQYNPGTPNPVIGLPVNKKLGVAFAAGLLPALILMSCTSTGVLDPNLSVRLLADATCVSALASAGITGFAIASGPGAVVAVPTAIAVLSKVHEVGASNLPATVLTACEQTLGNAVLDAHGVVTQVKGIKAAPAPTLELPPSVTPTK